ncbi:MAG TPA: hypothetical protein VG735_04010, partial [Caulobacterales bacterium]|nr:hypothetical protein [Caulobacterales bacterium]
RLTFARPYHGCEMKHARRPLLLSEQRLQRLSLWLALSVAWFAAHVIAHLAPCAAERMLTGYARHARLLLVVRAVRAAGFRRGAIHADMRRLLGRAVAGAALRRAWRAGPLSQRAGAICAALAAPERWVAHIAKRLQRGFTKLRRLPAPRRTRVNVLAQAPHATSVINSS